MRISFLAVISAALTLTGCTTLPKSLVDTKPISAAEIFGAVACEFVLGAEKADALNRTSAVIALTLSKTDNVVIMPSADWSATVGSVEVSAAPSGKVESDLQSAVTVTHSLDVVGDDASPECPAAAVAYSKGLNLAGELSRLMMLIEGASPNDEISEMGITHTFTVNRTAGGGLAFSIGDVKVKFDGSQASRENVNTLKIVLTPIRSRAEADKAQRELKERLEIEERNRQLLEAIRNATETGASPI